MRPRKSFGHEGAERFHGRMGGGGGSGGSGSGGGNDRFGGRDDRRLRDRDDREGGDRRNRNFDHRSRDQDGDETETPRRNGLGRGKSDSWFRDSAASGNNDAPMSQRERIEKAKSWRDRDPEDRPGDRYGDRNDRNHDRRWDRDRHSRVENDPEWLDEAADVKTQGHTEEDFRKFMEAMKATRGGTAPKAEEKPSMSLEKPATDVVTEVEQKVVSAPAMEPGPDKFFATYGKSTLEVGTPGADNKDAARPKAAKSSRFMAFLAPQDDRAKTEPTTPAAGVQPGDKSTAASQQSDAEKEAFALLIQKLQRSGMGSGIQSGGQASQPAVNRFPEPSPFQELQQKSVVASPEPYQHYGNNDAHDDPRIRTSQPSIHDILSPRPVGPPVQPPPVSRPEQALQDLLAQRHPLSAQANARAAHNTAAVNSNTEYLMRLMQGHRDSPDPPRTEQLLRMPQPTKQVSLANLPDREQDYARERSGSQRQQLRGQGGPPGFLDDNQFHPADVDNRQPPQPTQILQRPPPPPGLDHQMHPFHMAGVNHAAAAGQMPSQQQQQQQQQQSQQQRHMIPPPGLMTNGPRNVTVPPMPGMYPPPNFPPPHHGHGPGSFPPGPPPPPPHPDGLVGPPPPRSMQPPPGFFGGPPPPGFMPHHAGFQGPGGPEGGPPPPPPPPPSAGHGAMAGFAGLPPGPGPFERRGILPPGGYRGP